MSKPELAKRNIYDQRGKRTDNPIPTNQSVAESVMPIPPEASSWKLGNTRLVIPPPSEKLELPLSSIGVSPKASKKGEKSGLPPYDRAAE